jgi:hypothetical protein
VPPVIRRGETLTVIAFPEPARMAGGRWFATRLRLAVVAVDGAPVSGLTPARVPTGGLTDFEQELIGGWSGCVVFSHRYQPYIPPAAVPPAAVAALADGPHTVRCTYQLRISDRVGKYAPLIDETVVLTAPFTLLPADPAAPTPAGPVVGAGDKADVGS